MLLSLVRRYYRAHPRQPTGRAFTALPTAPLPRRSINDTCGGGLVLWHPKGAMVRHLIEDFWKAIHLGRDYHLLYTPHIAKARHALAPGARPPPGAAAARRSCAACLAACRAAWLPALKGALLLLPGSPPRRRCRRVAHASCARRRGAP